MLHLYAIAGLTDFDSYLVGGLVSVVCAVGGLITWTVKGLLPKVLTAFEKRNDALILASEKTSDAVSKIPEAIKAFEIALLGMEKRIEERIESTHDKVLEELRDKRVSDLAHAVREAAASRPGG